MYIERDKAIKALIGWETDPTDEDIEYTLNEIPAADVAPVVRCKDCKHCQHDTMFNQMYCNGNRVTPEYFCADGERK